jgi:predicted AlkP superfamily pyrophosphatase or phosphodiesterase
MRDDNNSAEKSKKKYGFVERILLLLPPTIFLIFTFAIYMPSSLFISNIDDFALDYIKIVPLIALVSVAVLVIVYIIGLIIPLKRLFYSYVLLVFSLALGFYIQGNFLNPAFNSLNGKEIAWSEYKINGIISIIAWILVFVVPQVVYAIKENIMSLIVKWGSLFVTAMQLVSLVVLLLTTHKVVSNDFAVTKNGEFELSSKNNTIMFVVDTLDASWFEDMLLPNEEYKKSLKDFTYFDDAIAGGAPTVLGIPTLLTGKIDMDASRDTSEYYKDAYESSSLFADMQKSNCNVKLFTEFYYLDYCDKNSVDNLKMEQKYVISSRRGFMECLYKFVSFYAMPQFLKQNFWLYSGEFNQYITLEDNTSNLYKLDDAQFYQDFKEKGITTQNDKDTFVMYHLNGAHSPYVMDENAQAVPSDSIGVDSQIRGIFKIIKEYMDELKAKGIYDSSTIIITADHGGIDLYSNPAILVKERNANHDEMVVSDSKITFTNVNNTIASSTLKDSSAYGENVFEVGDKQMVRFHVAPNDLTENVFKDNAYAKEQLWSLLIIPADKRADEIGSFILVPYDQYDEMIKKYNVQNN